MAYGVSACRSAASGRRITVCTGTLVAPRKRKSIGEDTGQVGHCLSLTAKPSFEVPEILVRRLFERNARRMIDGLRHEIALRTRRDANARAGQSRNP